ncbi:ATP-binding protein [Alicyclobacillus ferrooxydans]|uniref:ATP-binding protein n=1 Tax=Alicyclobacillus ferrooxydans TaxID=471514 RepID=UPI0006D5B51F|nr:ATP-binding protein [Alicyclobacillus ferrooxydans]
MLKDAIRSMEEALKQISDINFALDEALIVAITDVRGNIIFANTKFCEISKYSRDELLGQNHRIINSSYHSKEFFRDMWRTIAQGGIWRGEIRNQAKDGTLYWMDTTIVPCLDEHKKPYQYVSFRIDITERKKAEEFLRRSDKISAVAQLASGIAHEIRNPLAALKWSVQLLQSDTDAGSDQVNMILSEIDRIDNIVNEFMLLAKPEKMHGTHLERKDLRSILDAVISLMNYQANRSKVQIAMDINPDLPAIMCDQNQLKQVFINLIKNAIEAMPDGGTLTIAASYDEDVDLAKVRVKDQGTGIPPELLSKIGEPFYTTKDKGTGLGLMICHQIIQAHKGRMSIESKPNEGTTIEIELPTTASLMTADQKSI